jgi:selenocysteine lyase/cysteine desulfurase
LGAVFFELHRRNHALLRRLWEGLSELKRVTLYGPGPDAPRTPTLGFNVRGMSPQTVAERLAERAVFVSHGDFYAQTVIERLGLAPDGMVRAGCACYTMAEEVDRLIAGVRELAER